MNMNALRLLMERGVPMDIPALEYAAIEESMPMDPSIGTEIPRNALAELQQQAVREQGIQLDDAPRIQQYREPLPEVMPPTTVEDNRRWQSEPGSDLPMNSFRIESGPRAGTTRSMNFAQPEAPQGLQPDLSQPIEIAGVGKGYYVKGKPGSAIINGQEYLLGVDREATHRSVMQDLARKAGRQALTKGQVDILRELESIAASRAQRSIREDPTSQAVLEKKFGKAPEGMRWNVEGKLEQMPGGKQEVQGKKAIELLDAAEPLLEEATGSGVGAAVDSLAGFFGESTPGAQATAKLKTIAGQLVAMMPRMEGPQSNYDVKLYQDMAGALADPTTPAPTRKAALAQIRALNAKYADNPQGNGGGNLLGEAREAIKRGAPREAVIKRLRERGIDPAGL